MCFNLVSCLTEVSTESCSQPYVLRVGVWNMATTPQDMKVKTLQGEMITVTVAPANTAKELRAMLLEGKECEDPIERELFRVEVLTGGVLLDDDLTVESAGLLCPESDAIEEWWKRPQKKASMKEVHEESSSRPMSRKLLPRPFEAAVKFWRWRFQGLWHPLWRTLLMAACLWHVSFSLNHWQSLNHAPSQIACLSVITPDSVIVVGAAAFVGCQALKHIQAPSLIDQHFEEHFRNM